MASNDETNEAEVSLLFENAKAKLEKIDAKAKQDKKQIIKQLAKDLEGKIPTDTISVEIVNQLCGKVSERFIHESLEEKYKQKRRVENARKQKRGQQEQQEESNENLAAPTPLNQEVKKEAITIDVDGREERIVASPSEPLVDGTHSREEDDDIAPSCHSQSTQTIVKTDNKECKTLVQKIDELEEKVHHYEKIIEETPIKTADQIISTATSNRETDQNGNNSTISSSGNEVVVDCECSISWPTMQKYVQHIYKSGKPLCVWINFQLNKQTGTVVAAYLGRIAERNRTDGEFGGVMLENVY